MLPQVDLDLVIEEAQSNRLYVDLSRLSVDYLFQVLGVRKYVLLKGVEVLFKQGGGPLIQLAGLFHQLLQQYGVELSNVAL